MTTRGGSCRARRLSNGGAGDHRHCAKWQITPDFADGTYSQHLAIICAIEARNRIGDHYALQFHLQLGFNNFDDQSEDSA